MGKASKGLSVDKAEAIELLVSLGFKSATNFNEERIVKKFKQLAEKDTADLECSNKKLLDKIVAALEADEELTITESEEDEKPAKADKKAKAEDKPAKSSKKAKADEDDDDEDEDKEDEKPAKKDKKADKKADKKPKGEGVIGVIAKILLAASEKKPVTKDAIVEKLTDKFEDRDPDSMRGTVNVQVPSRISKERDITVHKNDKGYWATEGRTEKAEKTDKKSEKADKKSSKKAKKEDDDEDDE